MQELPGPFLQFACAQAEHGGEVSGVDVAQERGEHVLGQRTAFGVLQRVLVSFAPLENERLPSSIAYVRLNPKLLIIVQEIVGGLGWNAKEQVTHPAQQRAFPRLIEA